MSDERLEAIKETLGLPDPVVKDSSIMCLQASEARYLLDHIEAQREVVEAARSVDAEYHSLPHEKRGNLDRLMARLRDALDKLEEQTDD